MMGAPLLAHELAQSLAPRVLDVSAGPRAAWVDRQDRCAVFVDLDPATLPDLVADSRSLPFPDGSFDLAVFDPPHTGFSAGAGMARAYGRIRCDQIPELVRGTARELARVVRPGGVLSFKWNDHTWALGTAVAWLAASWVPMFGQFTDARRTGQDSRTSWVLCRQRLAGDGELVLSVDSRHARRRARLASLKVAA